MDEGLGLCWNVARRLDADAADSAWRLGSVKARGGQGGDGILTVRIEPRVGIT
jgi:hypothetical protein